MDEHLCLGTQASHRFAANLAFTRERVVGIDPLVPVFHDVHAATTRLVELHGMNVDLMAAYVTKTQHFMGDPPATCS